MKIQDQDVNVARFAEMFGALSAEPRLRILRLLLRTSPEGIVVGEIQSELAIPGSTLSHHLERLKAQGLVTARRDARFLWYAANTQALEELLRFLFDECCSRSHALKPGFKLCK